MVESIVSKRTKKGFVVSANGFSAIVSFGEETAGIVPLNCECYFGKRKLAYANGSFSPGAKTAIVSDVFPYDGVPKSTGLRAIDFLSFATEHSLRKIGIKQIKTRTHPQFARFLKKRKYRKIFDAGTVVDLVRSLKNAPVQPLFLPKKPVKPIARKPIH